MKRNRLWLRRFASLWLFLIVLEIACPILDCQSVEEIGSESSANTPAYHKAGIAADLVSSPQLQLVESGSVGQAAVGSDDSSAAHCTDECYCHVTGIPSLAFDLPKIHVKPLLSAVKPIDAPPLALPPPFQPPKTA